MTLRLVDSWPKIPKEVGPAPQSGPGFKTERIPNPGDFPSSDFNRVLFFCKDTILTSNTSVHEPASRFGPALRLPRRSCAESAAFEVSRLNLGSTPVHLGDPVQWVNQPMVHLVNRSTDLDQSTPVSHRSTLVNHRLIPVKPGQRRKFRPRNLEFLRRKEEKSSRDSDSNPHTHRSALTRFRCTTLIKVTSCSNWLSDHFSRLQHILQHLDRLLTCPSD
ncbi:hypothetical protein PIB30_021711 [Stylosanthes scabra]|uniref:Uncharacterized protein n=1 Tax=Stylosanthes scabra TaxID=79078 RepID=A0ABU6R9A0_9FABA|nr:hypothetical protein [Stylosanthes scabra]